MFRTVIQEETMQQVLRTIANLAVALGASGLMFAVTLA